MGREEGEINTEIICLKKEGKSQSLRLVTNSVLHMRKLNPNLVQIFAIGHRSTGRQILARNRDQQTFSVKGPDSKQ